MGRSFSLLAVCVVLAVACGDDPARVETVVYTGITKTDAAGNVLENDADDWRDTSFLSVQPAYPNPGSGASTIKLSTAEATSVTIVFRTPEKVMRTIRIGTPSGGVTTIAWDHHDDGGDVVPDGIYRAIFRATERNGATHATHGDIQVRSTP